MSTIVLLLLGLTAFGARALDNGLARTPPMGWLSWERYRCNTNCKNYPDSCISEKLYMAQADRMVSDGYRDAGYVYVNIDDCWAMKERDSHGRLVADLKRFPSGIKALADYMHKRGLKLGIYGDVGTETCQGYPGSKFNMKQDAETFADWGIDSLKLDGCYALDEDFATDYPLMGWYLNRTERSILYSCSWPDYLIKEGLTPPYKKIAETCNLWRNYDDIQDSWASVSSIIKFYSENKDHFLDVAGPGRWNDPDMIIVGDYGLSFDEQRVQMAMWAMMAAPLYMSNDLRHIRSEARDLLLNRRVIAINQDPLGISGKEVYREGKVTAWTRPISPAGSYALAFLYHTRGGDPMKVNVTLTSLGLKSPKGYNFSEGFSGTPVGMLMPGDHITASVNPSGVYLAVATILS